MLVLSRKANESISIEPAEGLDPSLTLIEAFRGGPVVVKLIRLSPSRARIAVHGPPHLRIRRKCASDDGDLP
jgi:sRNA-binding carbon storage regulator CsrA